MSISATVRTAIGYTRTVDGEYVSDADDGYGVNGLDVTATLDATSTPPVVEATAFILPMTSGALTIDLTALLEDDGSGTFTALGKKVQAIKFRNPVTNAAAISVAEGGTNGHPLLGAAFLFRLLPGQSITLTNEGVDVGSDVASGDKTWDVTGTGTDSIEIGLLVG